MDLLKLLPILFIAAQGEARAIHQQLLPAIPGYVPVYIQQGPDVQVIYETGRKVAVNDPEKGAKPIDEKPQEEPQPQAAEEGQQANVEPVKESEPKPQEQAEEQPKEPAKAEEAKPDSEDKKTDVAENPEAEEQNAIKDPSSQESSSSVKVDDGSVAQAPSQQIS